MAHLLQRWNELMNELGATADTDPVCRDLIARYSEPLRAYHNLTHLQQCFTALDDGEVVAGYEAIELALWFHDAIYDPKAKDNEERSAELLRRKMGASGVPPDVIEQATALVLATKTHTVFDDASKLMLDCDLLIFGAERQCFREYERQIRTEYGWVPEVAYRAGRSAVLKKFLESPHIFSTNLYQWRYEVAARYNLGWSLDQLAHAPLLTRLRRIDIADPAPEVLSEAADVLRAGQLVAFPTETVYGLGANALSPEAVEKIFAAKGRPANNPIIVHVSDTSAARELVREWPETAQKLAAAFWPGPLTLVLPKSEKVPNAVTAGGPTVGIRCPQHPIALGLLKAAGLPIAAPSANRSTEVSPTRAEHVLESLDGRIELLLDGGQCSGGIESTVLDLSCSPPRLLRPGLITPAQIEAVIGRIALPQRLTAGHTSQPLPSPGLLDRHYAPKARLEVASDDGEARVIELLKSGKKIGWIALNHELSFDPLLLMLKMTTDPSGYAARLYAALRELDAAGVEHIVVAKVPDTDDWLAIRDRLRRASHPG